MVLDREHLGLGLEMTFSRKFDTAGGDAAGGVLHSLQFILFSQVASEHGDTFMCPKFIQTYQKLQPLDL